MIASSVRFGTELTGVRVLIVTSLQLLTSTSMWLAVDEVVSSVFTTNTVYKVYRTLLIIKSIGDSGPALLGIGSKPNVAVSPNPPCY